MPGPYTNDKLLEYKPAWTYLDDGVYYFVPDYDQIILFTWNGEEIEDMIFFTGLMLSDLHSRIFK